MQAISELIRQRKNLAKIPGPKLYWPSDFAKQMQANTIEYLQAMKDRYGDIVHLPFPVAPLFQVTDADLIGKVLMGTERTNTKSLGYRRIKLLLGEGLITSSGGLWKSQRRLANPAFHQKIIQTFFNMMLEETNKMIEQWRIQIKKDPVIDISSEMTKLTFTVIVKALFSIDVSAKADQVRDNLIELQHYANYLFYTLIPLPLQVPTPRHRKVKYSLKILNDLVFELIEEHKRKSYDDLLSVYLNAIDDETGARMSDQLLRDEVITLMLAGHDTTAMTMSVGLDLLAKNPRSMAAMQSEARALPAALKADDLKSLPYTNLVFSETMRLYPAAWSVGRELTEELHYKDYHFPKGSTFLLIQYLTHRSPTYWQDPEEFKPERFLPEASVGRHPFAYFPFGGGVRTCIGANLAKLESQIILTRLMQEFNFESIADHSYKVQPRISIILDPGVKLKVFAKS